MYMIKVSMFRIKINSTFIRLLQVVTNMKESRSLECVTKMSHLTICCTESCEPIIGYNYCWNISSIAEILKASFIEDGDLVSGKHWTIVWVWTGENITIM